MSPKGPQVPAINPQIDRIERKILLIRGQKVMLDSDLAFLYGVQSKRLNEAVQRNLSRFPEDFMFKLTEDEFALLRSQIATSKHGGRRYLPYVFTEQGVAMLSTVLKSTRAIQVNIEIMRAFVRLRRILASNRELARKLDELERKYDRQFAVVFDAIRQMMTPPVPRRRRIGFTATTNSSPLVGEGRVKGIAKEKAVKYSFKRKR